jgi:hypothetical protein
MSMDSNSYSVLGDNQKVYKSTGLTENPYLSETEKMKAVCSVASCMLRNQAARLYVCP